MCQKRFPKPTMFMLFILTLVTAGLCSCVEVVAQDEAPRATIADAPPSAVAVEAPAPAPTPAPIPAVEADSSADDQEVLTRGPIHEAFAKPGATEKPTDVQVQRQPPDPIEELPPDEKPDGDNVLWISGYWAWDADRDDFIWISGLWRNAPAGQVWVPGYWAQDGDAYRWVSGFWKKSRVAEAYVPAPPKSVEIGPTVESPGDNYVWTPGYWVYRDAGYVWRPGVWVVSEPNRIYVPATYTWTPAGYVFVDGYWDYPLEARGVIFAPVYFRPAVYVRPAFVYTPAIVVDTDIVVANLFVAPTLGFYCFGDYYATSYIDVGIYPWVSVNVDFHIGYHDPIFFYYHHHGWHGDHHWEDRFRHDYHDRRDHPDMRPPRTFRAQQHLMNERPERVQEHNTVMARPLRDVVQKPTGPTRFVKVDDTQRKTIAAQARTQRVERQTTTPVAPRADREKPVPTATVRPGQDTAVRPSTRPAATTPATATRPTRGGDTTAKPDTAKPSQNTSTRPSTRPSTNADSTKKVTRPANTPTVIARPPRDTAEKSTTADDGATPTRPERPAATPSVATRPSRPDADTPSSADDAMPTTRPERPATTPEVARRPSTRPADSQPSAEDRTPSRSDSTNPSRSTRPAATPSVVTRPAATQPSVEDRTPSRSDRTVSAPSTDAKRTAPSTDDATAPSTRGSGKSTVDVPTSRDTGRDTGRSVDTGRDTGRSVDTGRGARGGRDF